jgi:O-antigen ligase
MIAKVACAARRHAVAAGLAALLLVATLGEGGGSAGAILVSHLLLALLLAWRVLAPRSWPTPARSPEAGVTAALALFAGLFAVGALRAPYGFAAWLTGLELAACLAAGWLAANAGPYAPERIVVPLAAGAALQSVLAVAQLVHSPDRRPAGTFLNPNHLAAWLVAVVLVTLAAVFPAAGARRRSTRGRVALAGLAVIALAGIVLAGSRGAFAGLVAGGGLGLALRFRELRPAGRRAAAAGAAILLGIVVLALGSRLADHDPFRYHRLHIWRASLALVAERPLWGTGPGQFELVAASRQFADGEPPLRYDRRFTTTHSDLLRVPAELGLPAAAALAAAGLLAVRGLLRRRRDGTLPAQADGAVAALGALGVQALVDNPSTWPSVYLLGGVLAGALLARAGQVKAAAAFGPRPRLVLVSLLALVVAAGDVAPYLASRAFTRAAAGAQDGSLERAVHRNPVHPLYRLAAAERAAVARWTLADYARSREAAESAVRLAPLAAEVHRGAARVEARACRTLFRDAACRDRARAAWERAAALAPSDPTIQVELAAFLVDLGDPLGGRRAAERALSLEPESVLPRLLLADALLEIGDGSGAARARELLGEAEQQAARWPARASDPYGHRMMGLDPQVLERLARKLRAVEGSAEAVASGGGRAGLSSRVDSPPPADLQ